MRIIDYIAPNTAANPNEVYNDSALTMDMAVAKRKVDITKSRANPLVFSVSNEQELGALLQSLMGIKGGQRVQPLPTLLNQGYVDRFGNAQGNFKNLLLAKPKIEIFFALGGGKHAVIAMEDGGAAYVDPTGASAPQGLTAQQVNLPGFWLGFYDKQGDQQAKQQLLQKNMHLHQGVKQQDDASKHDSLDWCVANLEMLNRDIHATAQTLTAAKKTSRDVFVQDINGQRLPSDPRNQFNLTHKNESVNEAGKRKRQQQLDDVQKRHQSFHKKALKKASKVDSNGQHIWRSQPHNAWVGVSLSPPPEYEEGGDLNEYNSTRSNGMKNAFKIDDKNGIVATSMGGKVTYQERFLRIAEDLQPIFKDNAGNLIRNVVINSIEPPEEQQACLEAFEKVFGKGNVSIKNASTSSSSPSTSSISAGPVFN